MAHFALLDQEGVVIDIVVVNNDVINNLPFPESEPFGIEFLRGVYGIDTTWKQTSYNKNFRGNYAGIGYHYDSARDAFIPPQPFPSWVFNEEFLCWAAPVPRPAELGFDGQLILYVWDEAAVAWVSVAEHQ